MFLGSGNRDQRSGIPDPEKNLFRIPDPGSQIQGLKRHRILDPGSGSATLSVCDEISSPYAQCAIKFFPRMLSMNCTCKNVHILPLAEHARKFVPRMLSMR